MQGNALNVQPSLFDMNEHNTKYSNKCLQRRATCSSAAEEGLRGRNVLN